MEHLMVFIDGSNLYHSLKEAHGRTDVSFEKLCSELANGRQLVRASYDNATVGQAREPQRHTDQQRFFDRLRRVLRLEVRLGTLVYRGSPPVPFEKGIDVRLATDMLTHAYRQNYETAILVSGDNDFADAVQATKDLGRNVEVALFGRPGSSRRLRDCADDVISLEPPFFERCWVETEGRTATLRR